MRAGTRALLGLLIVCNVGWYLAWQSKEEATAPAPDVERLEEEVQRLHARLAAAAPASEEPSLRGADDASETSAARQRAAERREQAARSEAEALRRQEAQARHAAAAEEIARIEKQIHQIRDPGLREEGLRAVIAILAGDDAQLKKGALQALIRAKDTTLDANRFRPSILESLEAEDPWVRRTALYALYNVAREEGDLTYALQAIDDPSAQVRDSASHLIHMYAGGTIEGEAADGILRLLNQDEPSARKEAMRGIWGAKVTPAIQARLLEIAKNPPERYDAVYFGLSTLNNKSRDVVAYLVEALADPNGNVSGRARWGLGYGISKEDHAFFAETLAAKLDFIVDVRNQLQVIELIERHGGVDQVGRLLDFADNELADERAREAARRVADKLSRAYSGD